VGDVVSIGTGEVVQTDHPPDEELIMNDEQVGEFIALVRDLDFDSTRESQLVTMAQIKRVVEGWPDG
jgi:hypothetical protein